MSDAPVSAVGLTLDTSCSSSILMVLPSLICGLTLSVRPTSRLSMVWKGLSLLVESCCPVTKGTFAPTTISASSLSRVTILGVERILLSASEAIALTRNPKSISPDANLPSASDRPAPSDEGTPVVAIELAMPSAPSVPPPRFEKPIGASLSLPSSRKLIPNSRVLSSVISAITASTSTCARRISSCLITASMFCISSGGAVMIRALVFGSACISTLDSPVSAALLGVTALLLRTIVLLAPCCCCCCCCAAGCCGVVKVG